MKKLILPALLLVMVACTKPAPPAVVEAPDPGIQNKDIVTRFSTAALAGDTVALAALLDDKAMIYGPGLTDSTNKEHEINFWKNGWKNDWESVTFDRAAIVAFTLGSDSKFPGDWVSDWGKWSVKEKNGKSVTFWWNGVFSVRDGKIAAVRAFYNLDDFYKQEGFTVTPPKPAKKK